MKKLIMTAAVMTVTGLLAGAPDVQAKEVYRVDRYGELTKYSGNPVVTIRSNTSAIDEEAFLGVQTSGFRVSGFNAYLKSVNGVLYSKDGSVLIQCPTAKEGSFTVPSSVKKIAENAFRGCRKLTRVTIPDSVTSIGKAAFQNASMLTDVRLSSNVKNIRSETFDGCYNLREITIPGSVKEIGANAFSGCKRISKISIPDSVTSIGYHSFAGCTSVTGVRLSRKMTYIPSNAFRNAVNLKTISNTANIEEIASRAFDGCIRLNGFSFSERLDSIGWEAFHNCKELGVVRIPAKTSYIAGDAFVGAASKFVVDSANPNYAADDGVLFDEKRTQLIQVPAKRTGTVKIPEGVKRISKEAFAGCEKLEQIYLPASLRTIDGVSYGRAQLGLKSLKKITIPDGNPKYKQVNGVLYSAKSMDMVFFPSGRTGAYTLPDECKKIGLLMQENKLSEIRVSENNKYFTSADGVLYNLRGTKIMCFPMNKTSYVIPKTLRSLEALNDVKADLKCEVILVEKGNGTFYCRDGVVFRKYSDELLFYPTKKKGDYVVPKRTRLIDSKAFSEAHNLTGLTITQNVRRRHASSYSFDNCRRLKRVLVKQGKLNYICMDFSGCDGLKRLTFPSNIMKTTLNNLPEGVSVYGYNNTKAREAVEKANGTFVSRGTILPAVKGMKVRKIIDKYEIRWNANREADGYQVYTTSRTIKNLTGSGSTSCYVDDIYGYGTIYVRSYCVTNGKKVYGKAKALHI